MKPLSRFTMLVAMLSLLIGASGCFHTHKHVRHAPQEADSPPSPKIRHTPSSETQVKQVSLSKWLSNIGGFRRPERVYTYQYYPTANIYYDTTRKLYFFTDGEDWIEDANLPAGYQLNTNEAVTVRLKSDKPYLAENSIFFYAPNY